MPDTMEKILKRLRAVYSDTTVHHIIRPKNNKAIQNADGLGTCRSHCGESMKIWIKIRNDAVWDTGFWTDGCAATIACGSMITELAQGKTLAEAMQITGPDVANALGNLPRGNLHNADLAADALRSALKDCLVTRQQPWKKLYRK